jgi:hypothetical protein
MVGSAKSPATAGSDSVPRANQIPFIDLEQLLPSDQPTDLIKCDIEGSEIDFISNYLLLLGRTRYLVVELHQNLCDVAKCRQLLAQANLVQDRVLSDHPIYRTSTELFRR